MGIGSKRNWQANRSNGSRASPSPHQVIANWTLSLSGDSWGRENNEELSLFANHKSTEARHLFASLPCAFPPFARINLQEAKQAEQVGLLCKA